MACRRWTAHTTSARHDPSSSAGSQRVTRGDERLLPFFSAPVRAHAFLKDDHVIAPDTAREFFARYPNASFVLNPGSDYGKELLPDEVGSLLNPNVPQSYTVDKPTEVRIGAPEEYPAVLVQALTILFQSRREIVSARVLQIQFPDRDEAPHPLIGIETEGAWDPLAAEIHQIVTTVMPGKPVDLMPLSRIKKSDALNATMLQAQPFYTRTRAPH